MCLEKLRKLVIKSPLSEWHFWTEKCVLSKDTDEDLDLSLINQSSKVPCPRWSPLSVNWCCLRVS